MSSVLNESFGCNNQFKKYKYKNEGVGRSLISAKSIYPGKCNSKTLHIKEKGICHFLHHQGRPHAHGVGTKH